MIDTYGAEWVDFDIEGAAVADSSSIDRRNKVIAALQSNNPTLKVAFCLPSTPATGLTADGRNLLSNALANEVRIDLVNAAMTMDFYAFHEASMAENTIAVATNLAHILRELYPSKAEADIQSMIGLTPMIGLNDDTAETFSLNDATQVLAFAQSSRIGLLSMWSAIRDNGGCPGATAASPKCSGISQSDYDFSKYSTHSPAQPTSRHQRQLLHPLPVPIQRQRQPSHQLPAPRRNPHPHQPRTLPEWSESETYVAGDMVTYSNSIWRAKWWTQGDVPNADELYGPWELIVPGPTPTATPTPTPTATATPIPTATPTPQPTPTPTPTPAVQPEHPEHLSAVYRGSRVFLTWSPSPAQTTTYSGATHPTPQTG